MSEWRIDSYDGHLWTKPSDNLSANNYYQDFIMISRTHIPVKILGRERQNVEIISTRSRDLWTFLTQPTVRNCSLPSCTFWKTCGTADPLIARSLYCCTALKKLHWLRRIVPIIRIPHYTHPDLVKTRFGWLLAWHVGLVQAMYQLQALVWSPWLSSFHYAT